MLDLLCGVAVGALAAWQARKLRTCLPQEEEAAPAKLLPAASERSPAGGSATIDGRGDEPAEAEVEEPEAVAKEGKELEAPEPCSPSPPQSCADDSAGLPSVPGLPLAAMAASGQSPCGPQSFHSGTFRPPEEGGQSNGEDEASIAGVIDGPLATARSNATSTVEHYCIASYIGSEGSSGQHDCACSSRDGYTPANTGLVAGGSEGGTCVRSEGGPGLHDGAVHPPAAVAARITGRSGKFYVIEVSGKPGAPPAGKLHRRYSEFAVLEHLVRHKFAGLPKLPRKSVFSKRFNPGFLPERERGLEAFLGAVVAADPVLEDSSVRAFLDPAEQQFCLKGEAASGLTSPRSSCSSGGSSHAQSSRT